jgi:hypothetical protein
LEFNTGVRCGELLFLVGLIESAPLRVTAGTLEIGRKILVSGAGGNTLSRKAYIFVINKAAKLAYIFHRIVSFSL